MDKENLVGLLVLIGLYTRIVAGIASAGLIGAAVLFKIRNIRTCTACTKT